VDSRSPPKDSKGEGRKPPWHGKGRGKGKQKGRQRSRGKRGKEEERGVRG
jgi:hypothetical protein